MRRIALDEARGFFERIDGARYGAYRRLYGVEFICDCGVARFTRVQGDPYAPPSILEVRGAVRLSGLEARYPVATADYAYRLLYVGLRRVSRKRGTGHSGFLGVPRPSPVMVRRSGFELVGSKFTARIWFGLPARGRRVKGIDAYEMLVDALRVVCSVVKALVEGGEQLRRHVVTYAVQEHIRSMLPRLGLVSFIGDGSILPRKCGWCEEPLPGAVPFESPPELRVEVETPWGVYTGMGLPRGFTVVIGHPFHGKTTLLEAIAAGVYNHVPGDGRERVVTVREAYWVEAEDGRPVNCRDISPLIHSLPGGKDVGCFETLDASGATSMAASIVEAIEAGAKLLIVDEDRAATNLLRVDPLVEKLAGPAPVTPLVRYARCLASKGVSVVAATGAISELAEAADTVLLVKGFRVYLVARREHSQAGECRLPEKRPLRTPRLELKADPPRLVERRGDLEIDLSSNRVLVEDGQYKLLALLTSRGWSGRLDEIASRVDELMSRGFDVVVEKPGPDLTEVRGLDVVHAVARIPPR